MQSIGLQGIITIISHLFFIWISLNLVSMIDTSKFIKRGDPKRAQLLMMFIAITLGFSVSSFFISVINASQNLKFLF
ncbi:hypothetical protein RD055328_08020 [Companilactobacillus sp. RD055328]|uniref:DUF1146 family protein n=1 Tax=Companilactobacillus sp. RD055328 TaxID=2916634 RepID=UPI002088E2FB|nr:DUF1146 family protein [Companilactobacillus sp. RD055328]GKQ42879.1 hypothetical protein RD055328_08020 [Companilactobacillus sp. RD055328]